MRVAAAAAVLALVSGCTVQDAGAGGTVPPVRVSYPVSPPARPSSAGTTPAAASGKPADDAASTSPEPPPAASASHAPAKPAALMSVGSRSGQVRELQARLRKLSYFGQSPTGYYGSITAGAVSAFQKGHGLPSTGRTDATTWQRLRGLTGAVTHDELYPPTTLPVTAPDPRCLTGRALCISKKSRTLAWMVNGRTLSAMDVRFGSQYTPTRDGSFEVYWKSRHHVSTIYDSPMPYAMFFSGGQAVHYSSDFAARGYAGASHGCVNVRDEKKIAVLFDAVRTGDKVIVY